MATLLHPSLVIDLHGVGDAVPEWVHLVPAGAFEGADGRGPYTLADPQAVIARSMRAGKLCLDECHSTDLAAPKGQPAPARGWIVEMQARADGIWGRVEWTPAGRALMAEHSYRGISPVMRAEAAAPHAVVDVLRASLTNDPNLPLSTLHHREVDPMSLPKEVLTRLGLAEGADEAAVAAAIGKTLDTVEAHAKTIATIGAATAAPSAATGEQLVTHLQSIAAKAAGAGDVEKMAGTIVELQSKLDKMSGDTARERAERVVDQAIADGKPIKALRDHYVARHAKDPAAVEKELQGLVSVHSGGVDPQRRTRSATCTSDDPREIQRAAELHQKEHGGSYEDAVLTVTGRI
ncbi:MAG: phage protease [Siculibacillus sp.]